MASSRDTLGPSNALLCARYVEDFRAGEQVFAPGEDKQFIYLVEKGLVAVTWDSPDGEHEQIEHVTPFMVFGLGFLDHHIYSAVALVESTISFWPKTALEYLAEHSPSVTQRQAEATVREFVHHRELIVTFSRSDLLQRLAGLLGVVSRLNANEGRDPTLINETVTCDLAADFLKTDVATLGRALVRLKREGIIVFEPPHGIRIRQPDMLDRMATGARYTEHRHKTNASERSTPGAGLSSLSTVSFAPPDRNSKPPSAAAPATTLASADH